MGKHVDRRRKLNTELMVLLCMAFLFILIAVASNLYLMGKLVQAEQNASEALRIAKETQSAVESLLEEEEPTYEVKAVSYSSGKPMTVTATAYCSCPKCCGVWSEDHPSRIGTDYEQTTYTGTEPTEGRTIAVDPDVIPLGSEVIIDGKIYVAEDIGGAIKGNHIDIYFDSHEEALEWGKQEIEVTVVER